MLAVPRLHGGPISLLWILGLVIALASSLSSAFYRVYFKVLLQKGLLKSTIVFFRLIGITLVLGGVLLVRPELFRADILAKTALIGLFWIWRFQFSRCLAQSSVCQCAVTRCCYFFLPALTYALSAALGYGRFYMSDLLAGGLLLLGVAAHELHMKRLNRIG